jgi:hypothetical protein
MEATQGFSRFFSTERIENPANLLYDYSPVPERSWWNLSGYCLSGYCAGFRICRGCACEDHEGQSLATTCSSTPPA